MLGFVFLFQARGVAPFFNRFPAYHQKRLDPPKPEPKKGCVGPFFFGAKRFFFAING